MNDNTETLTVTDVVRMRPCRHYTKDVIKNLWGGKHRLTLLEILDLDIPIQDRLWCVLRAVDRRTRLILACDYAGHVLPVFEARCPDDQAPRDALLAARKVIDDDTPHNCAAAAAADYAAAAAADYAAAAAAAAYAAAAAAAYAADAAAYAAYAAAAYADAAYADAAYAYAADAAYAAYAYAAAAYAADAAAADAYAAAAADAERDWQLQRTREVLSIPLAATEGGEEKRR